jgi:hypothetical protein
MLKLTVDSPSTGVPLGRAISHKLNSLLPSINGIVTVADQQQTKIKVRLKILLNYLFVLVEFLIKS